MTDDSTINKDMWKKFTGVINDVLCELLSEEKIELGNGHFFSWHAEDEVADIKMVDILRSMRKEMFIAISLKIVMILLILSLEPFTR
ncbi:hypothetical protein HQK29_12025 [Vibrio vulnificus]|nr:hypothetical protein [Vibrio vulnificus]